MSLAIQVSFTFFVIDYLGTSSYCYVWSFAFVIFDDDFLNSLEFFLCIILLSYQNCTSPLHTWLKLNFLAPLKCFELILSWNTKSTTILSFLRRKVLICSILVLALPNKMVGLNEIQTYIRDYLCFTHVLILVEHFLGETALSTVYNINRIPSSVIHNQSPYKCLLAALLILTCLISLVVLVF